MNREEFLKRLAELLDGISPEEREEALAYYRSYFEDAGVENEEKVLRELESPERLAASIRAGLQEDELPKETVENVPEVQIVVEPKQTNPKKSSDRTTLLVVLIVVGVVTCPVWLGFVTGMFGLLLGIIGALIGITVGFLCGGVACIGIGISYFWVADVPMGLLSLGGGSLLIAGGILALLLLVLLFGRFLPWIIRGIVRLFGGNRKEKRV